MNRTRYRFGAALILALLFFFFAVRTSAESAETEFPVFTVTESGGEYTAENQSTGERITDGSLTSLFSQLPSGMAAEFSSVHAESLHLYAGERRFSGTLILESTLTSEQGTLSFLGFSLSSGGASPALRIKSGCVVMKDSSVDAENCAVRMDYSSDAVFRMESGEVRSSGEAPALYLSFGSAEISGGTLSSAYGPAIENTATLRLSGSPRISGNGSDLVTGVPVALSGENGAFSAEEVLTVTYRGAFPKGSMTEIFRSAEPGVLSSVLLRNQTGETMPLTFFSSYQTASGEAYEERNFAAVYLPFSVTFSDGESKKTEQYLSGERICLPEAAVKNGYEFLGWYDEDGTAVSVSETVTEDRTLTAKFALSQPTFSLSGLSFVYDGNARELSFSSLSHPLAGEGSFTYLWYRGETPISSEEKLSVRSVSESGGYSCLLTFSHLGEIVTVKTPAVSVRIEKLSVSYPATAESTYNALCQYPDLPASPYYTVTSSGGIHAGDYPFTLTLTDPVNTRFSDTDSAETTAVFRILKAENRLLLPFTVSDCYEGETPQLSASLQYGDAVFTFSRSRGGVFSTSLPIDAGTYYVRVEEKGNSDVNPFYSEAVSFVMKKDAVTGLLILSHPPYDGLSALSHLPTGEILSSAHFESGKTLALSPSSLTVVYQNGDCLHVGDSSVTLSYAGYSVPLPVSVIPAERDLAGFSFADGEVTYDAAFHTLSPLGDLPDGLSYRISGGGTDVGTYPVTLTFCESDPDYRTPPSRSAILTVTPREVPVKFENLVFTYDGTPKCPSASFTAVSGAVRTLSVSGGKTDAGTGYLASAVSDDGNYSLCSSTCFFEIRKACADLSSAAFSATDLTYTGTLQSVTLGGLPSGISVLGYTNASFTDAGSYLVTALLGFDKKNYDCPETFSSLVCVHPAAYDMSGVVLADSAVTYDGSIHYPSLLGTLPVGKDGSRLSYVFDRGVLHAGSASVTVTFSTESQNYLTPAPMTASVTVSPKPVTLFWSDFDFVYNGEAHAPRAECSECGVTVKAGAVHAGSYTAEAVLDSTDYTPSNPTVVFIVRKAANAFVTLPCDISCYESRLSEPYAAAERGSVGFLYYADAAASSAVERPSLPGTYWYRAVISESEDYSECVSPLFRYEILPVVPTALSVSFTHSDFTAFSDLTDADFFASLLYSDGTSKRLLLSELSVEGEMLCRTESIGFRYAGFQTVLPISVGKASYDLSAVAWQDTERTYTGFPLSPTLAGLPEGVTCLSVNSFINAGYYEAEAKLSYDSENYLTPSVPPCRFTVRKQTVALPDLSRITVRDGELTAALPSDGRYLADYPTILRPGKYSAVFTLTDPQNTCFEGTDEESVTVSFTVRRSSDSASAFVLVLGGILVVFFLFLLIFRFWTPSRNDCVFPESLQSPERVPHPFVPEAPSLSSLPSSSRDTLLPTERGERSLVPPACGLLSVDSAHADLMISNLLAKSLIHRSSYEVVTSGRRRAEINVDTLSSHFEAGDRVDINLLKERGLIPKDAGRLKVLGRGSLDKPLLVFADAFSPCAIKMIALTGGSCYQIKTKSETSFFSYRRKISKKY